MRDYAFYSGLILVGGDGDLYPFCCQSLKKFRHSRICFRAFGAVFVIIPAEVFEKHLDCLLRGIGSGSLHKPSDAISHHIVVGSQWMLGISPLAESIIACVPEISDCVEQSAVEIKDYKFFHIANVLYVCHSDDWSRSNDFCSQNGYPIEKWNEWSRPHLGCSNGHGSWLMAGLCAFIPRSNLTRK